MLESKICAHCEREFKTEKDFLFNTNRWRICGSKNLWFNCKCGSTLLLPSGKYSWYDPTKNMSFKASGVFNSLAQKDKIPLVATSVMKCIQHLDQSGASALSVSKIIKQDPLLAFEIMDTAFGIQKSSNRNLTKITSLEHAVSYIGFGRIRDILLAASLKSIAFETKFFSQKEFWNESKIAGLFAESISARLKIPSVDDYYLAASLADIGKILAAIFFPKETDLVHQKTRDKKILMSWDQSEDEVGIDHRILGEIASTLWGFPQTVMAACVEHHRQPMVGKKIVDVDPIDIVSLSIKLKHSLLGEFGRFNQTELELLSETYSLEPRDIDETISHIHKIAKELNYI